MLGEVFLDGVLPLLRRSTALDSAVRVSWICLSSGAAGCVAPVGVGISPWPMSSLMTGCAKKARRCGFMKAPLLEGSVAMIELRIESKIVLEGLGGPVGVFDMVV